MPTRDELDAIAWRSIHERPILDIAQDRGHRALDYAQLEKKLKGGVELEHAWSDFLHAFYDYRQASFFAYPSPPSLSIEMQEWTDNPCFFLDTPWDIGEELGLDMSEFLEERLQRSPEAFRKRNVAYESRTAESGSQGGCMTRAACG